jgi:hypothetical protein
MLADGSEPDYIALRLAKSLVAIREQIRLIRKILNAETYGNAIATAIRQEIID